ncbi:hypothetical protein GCM10027596_04120 [Nocardioides korecus]
MQFDPVDSLIQASPAAVVASLTSMVARFGWRLTGVGDFGYSVTWRALDHDLELVELQAQVMPEPGQPGVVRLRVTRIDPALASIERFAVPPPPVVRRPRSVG